MATIHESEFILNFSNFNYRKVKFKGQERQKLLIVDDERTFREYLFDMFESHGCYDIDTAASGKEGIDYCKNNAYDVIISDIIMDNMTGLEMVSHLFRDYPDYKVFFVSGWFELEHIKEKFEDEFENGQIGYSKKPFKEENFFNQVYLHANPHLKDLNVNCLDNKSVSDALKKITPYQTLVFTRYIFILAGRLYKKHFDINIEKTDLTTRLRDVTRYIKNQNCKYNDNFCRENMCMDYNTDCAVKKLKFNILEIMSELKKINSESLKTSNSTL